MKPNFLEAPKNEHIMEATEADNIVELVLPSRAVGEVEPREAGKTTILLVSEDRGLHQELRGLANPFGRMVVRVDRTAGALPVVRVVNPVAVLLDLDLPNQGSWEIADALSREKGGPPMVLFTGRTDQANVETAISTGAVLDKSAGAFRLLEAVDEAVGLSDCSRARWNTNQLELVRWLSPCRWSGPLPATRRFWGIND
jgi:FixJ family two-component response regulator